ncbi:MAG: hypothetical protein GY852_01960, partial [bacterium]|nr:hypothetical protein [bacterium]
MVVINGQAERAVRAYAKAQLTLNLTARPRPARRRLNSANSAAQRKLRSSHLRGEVIKNLMERAEKTLNHSIDALSRADPGKDAIILEEIVRIYKLIGTYDKEGSRCNLHLTEMPAREQVEEAGKIFLGFSRAHSRGSSSKNFRIISREEREANHAM